MAESSVQSQFETNPDANDLQKSSLSLPLSWWYAVSGPADAPETANFLVREQIRRSRVV